MEKKQHIFLFLYLFFLLGNSVIAQVLQQKKPIPQPLSNTAPILSATGNQIFCPGSPIKIVTAFDIVDPDDPGIDAVYVQISSGYISSQDMLSLTGNHPSIVSSWNSSSGKLTLTGLTSQPTYTDMIAAVKDIVFTNSAANPSGIRTFSITIGQANYLPSNGHYYQYISNIGITWTDAKIAAEASTYYGLQGYLATITAADEAQLSGEQAAGAGWIGGSDEVTEGVWKWMTGPETGTVFWNGGVSGSSPTFAKWNTGEPNNLGNENYAHVTAPGVGIAGSWNDLSNTGSPSGDYQPKGYIVEYGGMPGDPVLHISASSTLTIPQINPVGSYGICDGLNVTLNATATAGMVNWYQNPTGGTPLATGNSYTTPSLTSSTTYYLDAYPLGCTTANRTPITVTVIKIPIVTVPTTYSVCGNAATTLTATASVGTVNWYAAVNDNTPLATGSNFTTPILSTATTYYVDATNNGCSSAPRIAVEITVNPIPVLPGDVSATICEGASIELDAGIAGMSYVWSTGALSQKITVTAPGQYSVLVSNGSSCTATRAFDVTVYEQPVLLNILTDENTVTILTANSGDFEYSVNGTDYQESNTFHLPKGGLYQAFVREIHGCGSASQYFTLVTFPAFFTPNGDGYNDYWLIDGMNYYPKAEVSIFDRFGKLITVLNAVNPAWDGTLNGKILLATDYWYVAKIDSSLPEKKGHFALKR